MITTIGMFRGYFYHNNAILPSLKISVYAASRNACNCVSIAGNDQITILETRQRDRIEAVILRFAAALARLESIGYRGDTAVTQYAKCRKAINRFLRNNRIGAIGHVSCIDRRSRIAESPDGDDLAAAIVAASADRLACICDLLGHEPTSVTARSMSNDRVASMQAFLQVNAKFELHYFATFDDGPVEHELWIEGSEGSLRTDGNSVWWRKRGWPVFIPTRIGLFGAASKSRSEDTGESRLVSAILRSERDRETVGLANAK